MLRSIVSLALLLLVAPGCKGDDELAQRCARALAKVSLDQLYSGPDAIGKPSESEQAIIDSVRRATQAKCEAEGLSKEQAACFESIVDIETLFEAADCPAVAAHKPSWFIVPPPEARREALERMKANEAQE